MGYGDSGQCCACCRKAGTELLERPVAPLPLGVFCDLHAFVDNSTDSPGWLHVVFQLLIAMVQKQVHSIRAERDG